MAAILTSQYKIVADDYATGMEQTAGVSTPFYDAAYEIVNLQVFDPEIDLLVPFYNAYLTAYAVMGQAPSSVITAVNRLQGHVLDKARYTIGALTTQYQFTDINDWLSATVSSSPVHRVGDVDTAVTVRQAFATLSSQAGYPIDAGNIVG